MSKVCVSLSIISVLALGGCQTTNNNWSDWEGIPHTEAVLEWQPAKPTDLYARKISYSGTYQEQWSWDSGTIFLTKAGFARHYRIDVSPREFSGHMADWDTFKTSSAVMNASEVNEIKNKNGKFYFADMKNDDGEDCWTFMQTLKEVTPGAYVDNGKPTGFIMGYDCGETRYSRSDFNKFASYITFR